MLIGCLVAISVTGAFLIWAIVHVGSRGEVD
jgi:hypothetical protein